MIEVDTWTDMLNMKHMVKALQKRCADGNMPVPDDESAKLLIQKISEQSKPTEQFPLVNLNRIERRKALKEMRHGK